MEYERIIRGLPKTVRKLNIHAAQVEREEVEAHKQMLRLDSKREALRAEWNRTVTIARNIENLLGGL